VNLHHSRPFCLRASQRTERPFLALLCAAWPMSRIRVFRCPVGLLPAVTAYFGDARPVFNRALRERSNLNGIEIDIVCPLCFALGEVPSEPLNARAVVTSVLL
jgi:hypothetical protein